MTRPHTTDERNRMLLGPRQYHARLMVRNFAGTWKDLSGFLRGFRISGNTDDAMVRASFDLHKYNNIGSIAPLVSSTYNTEAGDFMPIINSGNRIEFSIAVTAPLVAPISGDWHMIFKGKIDHPDWADKTSLSLECRDIGAFLADNQVMETRQYPAQLLEERIQQVILDNEATDVLVVPDPPDPAWVVRDGTLEGGAEISLLQKLRDYAAQIAWDVRYDWTTGDNFELLLYEVDRAKTIADFTLGPSTYKKVPVMGFDDEGVRNWISISFRDAVTGFRSNPVYKDTGSIAVFGRKPIQISFTDTDDIDTFIEADRMGNGMISDLSIPAFDHALELKLFWPVQLGDLAAIDPNDNHYDEQQKFGVFAFEHSGSIQEQVFTCDTVLTMRGKPSGGYRRWLEKAGTKGIDPEALPAPVFGQLLGEGSALGGTANDGRVWWDVTWDDNTEFVGIWAEESEDPTNVSTPDVGSTAELCGFFYRPEGTEGRARNFSTTIPVAIRPGFGARLIGAGFNKSNRQGLLNTPPAVIAADNVPPYLDGVVDSIDVIPRDLLDGYQVNVEVGDIDPDTESWLFIERDNMVVFRQSLGTVGNRLIGFTDLGLYPGTAISYMAYIWTRGQSGIPRLWNVSENLPLPSVGPRFALNTPGLVFVSGVPVLLVGWECSDPLADGIVLEMSGSLLNWAEVADAVVAAPGTVAGSWYLSATSPAYFRLVSKAGTVKLTYTPPIFFDGKKTVNAGPDTAAPVLSKSIQLVNGFPQLHILWTNTNSAAEQLILEQSAPGAGVWTELFSYANQPDGDYNAAPFTFTAKDYRMRAWKGATTIATSAILAYDGAL